MLKRLFSGGHPLVCLDVGANIGQSTRRICEEFASAHVLAVEPSPQAWGPLQATARAIGGCARIDVIPVAAGEKAGKATLHLTHDPQFASLLVPSEAGRVYHPEATLAAGQIEVPVVTLDALLRDRAIPRVDFLKIDVQGHELPVLRGAHALLSDPRLLAVNCEAQIVPEYDGASTFGPINSLLESHGFVLHQIHELWEHGEELQHSCLDALWIRTEALSWLRQCPKRAFPLAWGHMIDLAIARCERKRHTRVALYGAGEHTKEAVLSRRFDHVELCAVIDDDPRRQGSSIGLADGRSLPVVSQPTAVAMGVQAAVLSSNAYEHFLEQPASALKAQGVEVVRVYTEPGAWMEPDGPSVESLAHASAAA